MRAVPQTACIHGYLVWCSFFAFAVEEGKRQAAFFTTNKHSAPVLFHSGTPRVGWSGICFYCRVQNRVVNRSTQTRKPVITKYARGLCSQSPRWGGSNYHAAASLVDRRKRDHRTANSRCRIILHAQCVKKRLFKS
jgi:hypothetical protein